MVFYRACPKCKGDMDTRRDLYGGFRECLQCGLLQDFAINQGVDSVPEEATVNKKKGRAA